VATTRTSWRTVGRSWPGCFSPAVSAGTGDRARGGVKETGEAADACRMSVRLPRPTGIRNGGLLLVLVALAAVMALVDGPPEPGGGGRRLPGAFQSLPPPVGITQLPPTPVQPPTTGRRPPSRSTRPGGWPRPAGTRCACIPGRRTGPDPRPARRRDRRGRPALGAAARVGPAPSPGRRSLPRRWRRPRWPGSGCRRPRSGSRRRRSWAATAGGAGQDAEVRVDTPTTEGPRLRLS
jgi:hypothetical protein